MFEFYHAEKAGQRWHRKYVARDRYSWHKNVINTSEPKSFGLGYIFYVENCNFGIWGYLDISGCLSIFHIKYMTSVPTMTMSRSYTFNKMLSLRRYTAQGVRFYHPCAKTLTPGSLIAHPCAGKSAHGLSTVHPCTKKSAQGSDC